MPNILVSSFRLFRLSLKNNRTVRYYTGLVILLECLSVFCLYKLNGVYGDLYQAIQEYKTAEIWKAIWIFCGIAGVLVVINGYLGAFVNRLSFEIREGLTNYCIANLSTVSKNAYYEQRIQEDLKKFGESSCEFWSGLFKAIIKLPVFLGVVISLTRWYTGLFIFLTIVVGTILTRVVSKNLVPLQADQESNEALFRKQLASMGEPAKTFKLIKEQFYKINSKLKLLSFTQSGLGQAFVLLPFIVLMPLYITKVITMGSFFQSVNALGKIIDSLVILIDSRQIIVSIESSVTRIKFLL